MDWTLTTNAPGKVVLMQGNEAIVRGVASYLDTVFTPKPDKTYAVREVNGPPLRLGELRRGHAARALAEDKDFLFIAS